MGTLCRLRFGRDPFIDHLYQILLHNNSSATNLHTEAHNILLQFDKFYIGHSHQIIVNQSQKYISPG